MKNTNESSKIRLNESNLFGFCKTYSEYNYSQTIKLLEERIKIHMKKFEKSKLILENIESIIYEESFDRFAKLAKEYYTKESKTPCVTFHGTNCIDTVESIIRNGYLMPGEQCPETGRIISYLNGNYYGDGIYTSHFPNLAECYSFIDNNGSIILLANLIIPGNVKFLEEEKNYGIMIPYQGSFKYIYPKKEKPKKDTTTYQTIVSPDGKIIVTSKSDLVIPIFKLKIKKCESLKTYIFYSSKNVSNGKKIIDLYPKKVFGEKEKDLTVEFNKIVNDYYLVELSEKLKSEIKFTETQIKHYIIMFDDYINNIYQKSLKEFIKNLGSDVTKKEITRSKDDVGELFKNLDKVLDKITISNTNDFISIIYLLIPTDMIKLTKENTKKIINKYKIHAKMKSIVTKLIFIETSQIQLKEIENILHIKSKFTTINFYEKICHKIHKDLKNVGEVFNSIISENRNIFQCNYLKYSIPYPQGTIGSGFLTSFIEDPKWNTETRNIVIFKGKIPSHLILNYKDYPINVSDKINIEKSIAMLTKLLAHFRNYIICRKEKYLRYSNLISVFADIIMERMNEYLLSNKDKNVSLVRGFYLDIRTLLSDLKSLCGVKFETKWFNRLIKMKYNKSIMRRVNEIQLDKPIVGFEGKIKELSDILFLIDEKCYGLDLTRTASSEVEPWLIIVNKVSLNKYKICDIVNVEEFGLKLPYSVTSDFLPNYNIFKTEEEKIIKQLQYGYVFTRNPYLNISTQQMALYVNSWVCVIETIFISLNKDKYVNIIKYPIDIIEESEYQAKMEQIYYLTKIVIKIVKKNIILIELIKNIEQSIDKKESINHLLTEKYGIASINIILALLISLDDSIRIKKICDYISPENVNFKMSVMAECVMRSCRAFYKKTKTKTEMSHIRKILLIPEKITNEKYFEENYKMNLQYAVEQTNKFYRNRYSNTTPFALVAVFGFINLYYTIELEKMIEELKNISMKKFLESTAKDFDGKETQVALFLEGIKYHKSLMRQNLVFTNPGKIIKEHVLEQQEIIKKKYNQMKIFENNKNNRLKRKLKRGTDFIEYHKFLPNIFTHEQVKELNRFRPDDDKLEIQSNGLLKYHCCYPTCPKYLHNFRYNTKGEDIGRKGLYKHFEYDIDVLNKYLPSFHLVARSLITCETLELFIEQMDGYYEKNAKLKPWYDKLENRENKLKGVYNQYRILFKIAK
jgi:hypothetical protein